MKSKLIQIPYTVGIIKPHIALKPDVLESVYEEIQNNHFEIFHEERKILTKEEVLNLFYPHRNASYYADIQEHMMTAESIVMLLVNKVDRIPHPTDPMAEDIKLEAPVLRWKQLLGDKQPEVAKEVPNSLRGKFGRDVILNGFHGSDDATAANKERDVFLFQIPERPPPFEYVRTKIPLDMIFSFLYPPNLEHANSTGRLDLLALYGPIVNYHSVDYCFCNQCCKIAKEQLELSLKEKALNDKKRMGMSQVMSETSTAGKKDKVSVQKLPLQVRKLQDAPIRLLKETDLEQIFNELCEKCRKHCESYVHLPCGRGGQHLNNDIEIDALIEEINYNDLLALLTVEKGSTAKIMIGLIDLHEPEEIMYKREHVQQLLAPLETDYYGRYEFNDLQKMILEDRRLRMNYWTGKITHKPIEKFKNPNLLNVNEKVDRKDIKNPYFTLSRILPISLHMEKTKVISTDKTYDKLHFDFKAKYLQSEQDQIIERQVGKEFHRVCNVENAGDSSLAKNTIILRNYNDGRNGGWNNYVAHKGSGTGSYVKPHQK